MDLIDKALQLYDEIESRQRQLREILEQLQASQCTMHDAQCPVQDEQAADDNSADNLVSTETLNLAPSPKTTEDSSLKESSSSIEHKRPDLWKSLTINDRFRFRRELFAGDDAAMSEAINRISEMGTLSEADDYLSSMPWESDSEAVSEFMTILSNHFSRF